MKAFNPHAADALDPENVPHRVLGSGATMPAIGLGTFSNDRYTPEQIAESVLGAIEVGYRLIDCAAAYQNEPQIGEALAAAIAGGIPRADLFITSKLWNDSHAPEKVLPALRRTLSDLRLDYLDAYYIHWPYPTTHEPGAAHESRAPGAKPFDPAAYLRTYREVEKACDAGLVRYIATSNMTPKKLREVLPEMRIKPIANQMEMHPCFAQPEFFAFLRENAMCPVAYCPLGSPERPARDTAPGDISVMGHPAVAALAEKYGVHPAVICVRWAVTRGQAPIPSSIVRAEYRSNLAAACEPLPPEDMERLAAADCNHRLIKGQVFLWESATSWRDLWDE